MFRKTVCLFILAVTVVFILMSCSSSSKSLSITPSKVDFGDVYIGDVSDITLTLKNKYGKDITITQLSLIGSNDYIIKSGNSTPISLVKNAEHDIVISFNPQTAGILETTLNIEHDGSTKAKIVNITGKGVAAPKISLSETSFDFTKKLINKTHDHDFEIENTGSADLNITNISITGTGASLFSITSGNAPVLIQPSAKHTFTVTFSPIAIGNFQADIAISHDAVNETSPSTISLAGEGIDVDPQITLSVANPWDFGTVATTLPSIQICEIENTGIDPLTVSSASLTTGAEFTIDSLEDGNGNAINFPQTIAVGAKIFLAVKFTPTANTVYNDTLSFVHDGTNESTPLDISLTGTGRVEVTKTFTYTGAVQQWTVPAGVTSIVVECYGAQGGESQGGSGLFGKGGMAKAKVPVNPGDTVYIYVGGQGVTIQDTPTGGWNGGGGTQCTFSSIFPGSGGGASDIRIGGQDLSDRKVVGAGGGGGGYASYSAKGGDGGGLTGQTGSGGSHYTDATGGTQTSGGLAGNYNGGTSASSGVFGDGGRGKGNSAGGGGGGGGWYGGGGGLLNSGAGGSSYYDATGNTDKSTQSGVRVGDGEIIIKY